MNVVDRAGWGAATAKEGCVSNRDPHTITMGVVHYSDATPPGDDSPATDPNEHEAAAQVRAIQKFHMGERDWCDIAYHWLIAPDGTVFTGRPIGQVGAHAAGVNTESVGYCLLTDDRITRQQATALIERIHADRAPLGIPYARVVSHRDVGSTHCPGDEVAAWVAAGMPAPDSPLPGPEQAPASCADLAPGPPPEGRTLLVEGMRGAEVIALQALLAKAGHPPEGSKKKRGGWDGIFGAGTVDAVKQLQAEQQLDVDGKVGRQTWCALGVR